MLTIKLRLSLLLLIIAAGSCGKSRKSNGASIDCMDAQNYFKQKGKEVTWDEELEAGEFEKKKEKLVTGDFYAKYLEGMDEFTKEDRFSYLYFHSVPDIQTSNCWVIIDRVVQITGIPSHTYYLVDLMNKQVLEEVASFEDYPDGKKRMKSIFLDDTTLKKIKVMEYLGDYDQQTGKSEIVTDSIVSLYKFNSESNQFILTKQDSIRSSRW
jgi:hypothetical protein